MTFHTCPAVRCEAPGRAFPSEQEARTYAQQTATRFKVPVAVWRSDSGRLRHLGTVQPEARK
jgi:hypothetical protein